MRNVIFPTGPSADDARYQGLVFEPLEVWRTLWRSRVTWFIAGWMAGIFVLGTIMRLRGWCG